MKVVIDEDRCTGHGRCYALAPDLFYDDEYGNGQVNADGTVPPALEEQARRAVQSCPEQAITLE